MLVRNPYEALESEFNRNQSGGYHIGHASLNSFESRWKEHVYDGRFSINNWAMMNTAWFNAFDSSRLHVVFYDELVSNPYKVLQKVLEFLQLEIDKQWIKCAIEYKEGLYHRSQQTARKRKSERFDSNMHIGVTNGNHLRYRECNDILWFHYC